MSSNLSTMEPPPPMGGNRITAADRGPAVNLVVWISLVVMCLATLFKVFTNLLRNYRNFRFQNLQVDDYLITAAMLFALSESVAVSRQIPAGIGQHQTALSNSQIMAYEKAGYAAQLLYIASLSMAKLTVISLVLALARGRVHRTVVFCMGGFTVIWTVTAMFGIAFQCHIPRTWAIISNSCFNQHGFWLAIGILDILISLVLIGFPIYILWDLQVSWSKKSKIVLAFAIRVLEIPLVILRIVYIRRADISADHTYNDFDTAVTTQVLMNLSIILSCAPFLKPLVDNLQPGWSTSDMRTGLGYNTIVGKSQPSYAAQSQSFAMGSVIKSGSRTVGGNAVSNVSTSNGL